MYFKDEALAALATVVSTVRGLVRLFMGAEVSAPVAASDAKPLAAASRTSSCRVH